MQNLTQEEIDHQIFLAYGELDEDDPIREVLELLFLDEDLDNVAADLDMGVDDLMENYSKEVDFVRSRHLNLYLRGLEKQINQGE